MTAPNKDRLHRILQLALTSPYEGEREKAVGLFLQLLGKSGLNLHQLDSSFGSGDGENELRKRADLAVPFSVPVRSREEALLYRYLIQRFARLKVPVELSEGPKGYELTCTLPPSTQSIVEQVFIAAQLDLPKHLAAAQQQALSEYQVRRKILFEEAIQTLATHIPVK